ncbi:MAG: riboflavin synthase subunit alpha [Candidatus Thalassarchaeaceae archaeon]
MFTGIVEGMATLRSSKDNGDHIRWIIDLPAGVGAGLEVGASVALDGVCLTAVNIDADVASFDLIQETLDRSTLGLRTPGDSLNIERALRYGDEVGGHLVSGHVMGVGTVASITYADDTADLRIDAPAHIEDYIFEKGYIAIDGISLTVGETQNGGFNLHIIPETLRRTTLGQKTSGSLVNIEIDAMTQAVVDTVKRVMKGGVSQ